MGVARGSRRARGTRHVLLAGPHLDILDGGTGLRADAATGRGGLRGAPRSGDYHSACHGNDRAGRHADARSGCYQHPSSSRHRNHRRYRRCFSDTGYWGWLADRGSHGSNKSSNVYGGDCCTDAGYGDFIGGASRAVRHAHASGGRKRLGDG